MWAPTILRLGPHQALGHRRLGYQEGPRDLGRRQAAQRAQAERHPRLEGQRRMAAREDQAELVVAHDGIGERRRLTAERVHGRRLLP